MFQDGPKRQGRFLKAGSRVLDKVALQDFAFRDLSQVSLVSHDNPQRTVIHSKFHDPGELNDGLKYPDKFDADLSSEQTRRPVLVPMDFTKDWERDRKLRKHRTNRLGDEDADFEYEAALREEEFSNAERAQDAANPASHGDEDPATAMQNAAQNAFRFQREDQRHAAEAQAADAFNNFIPMAAQHAGGVPPHSEGFQAQFDPGPSQPLDEQPPMAQSSPSASGVFSPEEQAMAAYRARLDEQQQREAEFEKEVERARLEIQQMAEEARASGYRDGFRLGEEKSEIKARELASQTFGKVSELVEELSKLKGTILDNVQENFYEICQAMAEALFMREFSLDPNTFATIVRRVVADTGGKDEFTVKMHPDMFERLSNLELEGLSGRLAKDAELSPGDFRVESKLSVVDVSLHQTIADLLKQADLGLVESSQDQAPSHDAQLSEKKAG